MAHMGTPVCLCDTPVCVLRFTCAGTPDRRTCGRREVVAAYCQGRFIPKDSHAAWPLWIGGDETLLLFVKRRKAGFCEVIISWTGQNKNILIQARRHLTFDHLPPYTPLVRTANFILPQYFRKIV